MKKLGLILVLVVFGFAFVRVPTIVEKDGERIGKPSGYYSGRGVFIDSTSGDQGWRGVAGTMGKSITVSDNGDAIAVVYTGYSGDPTDFQALKIAYSLDDGATWATFGPFGHLTGYRRCYPGLTGTGDFDTNFGELWFAWHETQDYSAGGDVLVMIEEGTPVMPAPDGGTSLPQSFGPDSRFWLPSIAVSPDDPLDLAVTAFNAHPAGDCDHMAYYWISTDGGYTWTDSMNLPIDSIPTGDNGPFAAGPGDYLFYSYHNDYDYAGVTGLSIYFIESTDWGTTWSTPEAVLTPGQDTTFSPWWYEFDNLVINGEPWMFDMDIGTGEMWMCHATGSPGSWTWDIFDGFITGSVDEVVGDTHFVCVPWEFCQLSYDPVNNIILGGFLAQFIKVHVPTGDTIMNGFYAGGIYSMDGGGTWENAAPLSDLMTTGPNEIFPVEFAHRIVDGYTYCIWLPGDALTAWFDRGYIQPFTGVKESASNQVIISDFHVTPTIAPSLCHAAFTMPVSGHVALRMFDATGRLVETVFDGHLNKGSQEFNVRTSQLANGTYFLILETTSGKDMAKIIITH
jgi:hypothetical protein